MGSPRRNPSPRAALHNSLPLPPSQGQGAPFRSAAPTRRKEPPPAAAGREVRVMRTKSRPVRGDTAPSARRVAPLSSSRPSSASSARLPHSGGDVTSAAPLRAPLQPRSPPSPGPKLLGWAGRGRRGGAGVGRGSRAAPAARAAPSSPARPPRAEAARGMSVPRAAAAAASTRAPAGGRKARLLQRERSE